MEPTNKIQRVAKKNSSTNSTHYDRKQWEFAIELYLIAKAKLVEWLTNQHKILSIEAWLCKHCLRFSWYCTDCRFLFRADSIVFCFKFRWLDEPQRHCVGIISEFISFVDLLITVFICFPCQYEWLFKMDDLFST